MTQHAVLNQTVAQYKINVSPSVWFIATLKEASSGREFDIALSHNALDDCSQVFEHAFYTDFLIPWTSRQSELHNSPVERYTNVIQLKK